MDLNEFGHRLAEELEAAHPDEGYVLGEEERAVINKVVREEVPRLLLVVDLQGEDEQ